MNDKGFTLLESTISLAILSIALVGMIPSFQTFLDANTVSEERSNALAAAQQTLEVLRHKDPSTLPKTGSDPVKAVGIGLHEYEVTTHYCLETKYCSSASRHIVIEVGFGGKTVYTVETIFTRLH